MCAQTHTSQKSPLSTEDSCLAGMAGVGMLPDFLVLTVLLSRLQDGNSFQGWDVEVLGHRCGI